MHIDIQCTFMMWPQTTFFCWWAHCSSYTKGFTGRKFNTEISQFHLHTFTWNNKYLLPYVLWGSIFHSHKEQVHILCRHVSAVAQMVGLLQMFWFDNTAVLRKMSPRVRTSEIRKLSRQQTRINLTKRTFRKNTQVGKTQTRQAPTHGAFGLAIARPHV